MSKDLPERPNLEQLKKQAKGLLREKKSLSEPALERIQKHHPRFEKLSIRQIGESTFGLQDAQLVIAREYGFDTWTKLAEAVQAKLQPTDNANSDFSDCGKAIAENDFEAFQTILERSQFSLDELNQLLGGSVTAMRGEHERVRRRMAELLIVSGANPATDKQYGSYGTLIMGACEFNNPIGIRFLLERGASPNPAETKSNRRNTPLRMLLGTYSRNGRGNRNEAVKLLLEYGVEIPVEIEPEFLSIYTGDVDTLEELRNAFACQNDSNSASMMLA